MRLRKPTSDELRLLAFLISNAKGIRFSPDIIRELQVQDMNDGGMGSVRLFPSNVKVDNRMFGKRASECRFIDKDGTQVIASLNLDTKGDLFELDIWKTNFKRLIHIPEKLEAGDTTP